MSTYTDIPEGNTLNTTLREQFPFAIICSPICIKSQKYWHSYSFKNYHSTKSLDFTWSWGVKLLKNQHQISYKQKLKFLARIAHDIAQKKKKNCRCLFRFTFRGTLYNMVMIDVPSPKAAIFTKLQKRWKKRLLYKRKSQTLDRLQKVFGLLP